MPTITQTVFNLYLAIVCAFSLLATVIIAGTCINNTISLVYPEPLEVVEARFGPQSKLTEEEQARQLQALRASQAYFQVKNMLSSFVYLVLAGTVFAVHWRIFRRRVNVVEAMSAAPASFKKGKK